MPPDWDELFTAWRSSGQSHARATCIQVARRALRDKDPTHREWFTAHLRNAERAVFIADIFSRAPAPKWLLREMVSSSFDDGASVDFLRERALLNARPAHVLPHLRPWLTSGTAPQRLRVAKFRPWTPPPVSEADEAAMRDHRGALLEAFFRDPDPAVQAAIARQILSSAPCPELDPLDSDARTKILLHPERYGFTGRPRGFAKVWQTVAEALRRWRGDYGTRGLT